MERGQWAKWVDYFDGPVTKAVVSYYTAAGIAADTQTFTDSYRLPIPPVFTSDDEARVRGLLSAYNTVGRLLTGVHSAKYGIRLTQGDVDILAPPDMPAEDWQVDLYTLGAIPLIIYALAAGAVLISGLWAASSMMESSAQKDFTRYQRAILKADKEIMRQPPDVRRDWIKRRGDFERQVNKVQQETGFLVDIFGAKGGTWITIAVVALLALGASKFVGAKSK